MMRRSSLLLCVAAAMVFALFVASPAAVSAKMRFTAMIKQDSSFAPTHTFYYNDRLHSVQSVIMSGVARNASVVRYSESLDAVRANLTLPMYLSRDQFCYTINVEHVDLKGNLLHVALSAPEEGIYGWFVVNLNTFKLINQKYFTAENASFVPERYIAYNSTLIYTANNVTNQTTGRNETAFGNITFPLLKQSKNFTILSSSSSLLESFFNAVGVPAANQSLLVCGQEPNSIDSALFLLQVPSLNITNSTYTPGGCNYTSLYNASHIVSLAQMNEEGIALWQSNVSALPSIPSYLTINGTNNTIVHGFFANGTYSFLIVEFANRSLHILQVNTTNATIVSSAPVPKGYKASSITFGAPLLLSQRLKQFAIVMSPYRALNTCNAKKQSQYNGAILVVDYE